MFSSAYAWKSFRGVFGVIISSFHDLRHRRVTGFKSQEKKGLWHCGIAIVGRLTPLGKMNLSISAPDFLTNFEKKVRRVKRCFTEQQLIIHHQFIHQGQRSMCYFRPGAGGPGARGVFQGRIIEVGYIVYILCVPFLHTGGCFFRFQCDLAGFH